MYQGNNSYVADLYINIVELPLNNPDGNENTKLYEADWYRSLTSITCKDESTAYAYFSSHFMDSINECILAENATNKANEVEQAKRFLQETDWIWTRALDKYNSLKDAKASILKTRPNFFIDRQKARDIINGLA